MIIEQGYIFMIEVEVFTKTENECKIEQFKPLRV